jgi:hypothetical protein
MRSNDAASCSDREVRGFVPGTPSEWTMHVPKTMIDV